MHYCLTIKKEKQEKQKRITSGRTDHSKVYSWCHTVVAGVSNVTRCTGLELGQRTKYLILVTWNTKTQR